MKLRYLFDNRELAEMILRNWNYDKDKTDMLDNYRISANAVYPFFKDGEVYILRFSPVEERTADTVRAELEFLRFLRGEGYPVADTVASKSGNELESVETPWGDYLAVVFRRVPGSALTRTGLTDEIIHGYGKALGELHILSRRYTPVEYKRISWREQLEWMDIVLSEFRDETAARNEVQVLGSFLNSLPADAGNFGLVHYDFEADNVFYNEADRSFHVIDFDDAVYHWFVMDIEQAVDSITGDMPSEKHADAKDLFLEGYRSVTSLDDKNCELMPVFRRYANLNGYVRILRSIEKKWKNEPEWMPELREKLSQSMKSRSIDFGKPISV